MTVRALLDHAAESSFISERVAQLLRMSRNRVAIKTSGLQGTSTGDAKTSAQVQLRSPLDDNFSIPMTSLTHFNRSSTFRAGSTAAVEASRRLKLGRSRLRFTWQGGCYIRS